MRCRRSLCVLMFTLLAASCGTSKKTAQDSGPDIIIEASPQPTPAALSGADTTATITPLPAALSTDDALQVKYARYLKTQPAEIENLKLYRFIDQWLATPYKWGGMDNRGIDCSAFIQKLLDQVYNIQIPRTSVQQFFDDWIERFGSRQYLSEGDLVFFRTDDTKLISHVGMFLKNQMFVNSSSSKGVSIADLNDAYWKKRYVAAGRIRIPASSSRK